MRRAAPLWAALTLLLAPFAGETAAAQATRRVELRFAPTARAQLALWIESADGEQFATVRLTESLAVRGVGNRPGALQMNSGWRWPYGRREGALPIWAHRRVERGGQAFPRVIFNGRNSEGAASSAGSAGEPANTRDDYFCLSFNRELSGRDALDAVTCASVFNSNKGRFLTEADVTDSYAEPFQMADGSGMMRAMAVTSLYPPRRDVTPCATPNCGDHEDVSAFAERARQAMPEIDAVTMATPAGDALQRIVFDVPEEWPDGDYVAHLEINVEGDWNEQYNDQTRPTPSEPATLWDYWASNYGYAYRGQPSVLYRVPFLLNQSGGEFSSERLAGYGALHGEDGEVRPADATITDAPGDAPGSGADRLRLEAGSRLTVVVPQWNVCELPDPPAMCGWECAPEQPGLDECGEGLLCGPDRQCVGECDVPMSPSAIPELVARPHEDPHQAHRFARVHFEAPFSPRAIQRYEMRFGREPITDEASFERALPVVQATIENIELIVPTEAATGELVGVEIGGLSPETRYYVAVRAYDECNAPSPIVAAELETTEIVFTTVSPCFVATAAWGSPLAPRVRALRRFRDRHLATHTLGRALIGAYHRVGPLAAELIRRREGLRSAARAALTPLVWLAERL